MGNRANVVVVENSDWRMHYAHCTSYRMLDAFIGGPELALHYATSMEPCPKTQWVDALWADGGAVIDRDRRRLLFFGDELMTAIPERRAMLKVLDALWPGWTVSYAYDGVAEIADYVGGQPHVYEWSKCPPVKLARNRKAPAQVVSVIDPTGRVRLWPLCWADSQAWNGPALLDKLPGPGLARLQLQTHPAGGVHVDVGRKTMAEWHTADTMGICRELPDLWPGWRTESWADRFEEQARRCGPALRLPELDLGAAAASARAWIRKREPDAPYRAPHPTPAEWRRFTAACDALRADRADSA
ncbi:MAG: hypothetical protein M3Y90_13180 [Actinomycetota bacterium]|nr:hypothetical protein [Actinomycetota bacterium]